MGLRLLSSNRIELILNYKNKTQREFLISFPDWCANTTTMSDDAGNDYRCESHTGIDSVFSPTKGLTLPSGGNASASFRFSPPQQMARRGTRFSFNSTQLTRIPVASGEPRVEARYAISILNIEPR